MDFCADHVFGVTRLSETRFSPCCCVSIIPEPSHCSGSLFWQRSGNGGRWTRVSSRESSDARARSDGRLDGLSVVSSRLGLARLDRSSIDEVQNRWHRHRLSLAVNIFRVFPIGWFPPNGTSDPDSSSLVTSFFQTRVFASLQSPPLRRSKSPASVTHDHAGAVGLNS